MRPPEPGRGWRHGRSNHLPGRDRGPTAPDGAIVLSGVRRHYATASRLNPLTGRRVPIATFESVHGVDLDRPPRQRGWI